MVTLEEMMERRWTRTFAVATLLFGHAPAAATVCSSGRAPGWDYDAIFLGRVDEAYSYELPPREGPGGVLDSWSGHRRSVRVTVGDVWIGDLPDVVSVVLPAPGIVGGPRPKAGQTWLFRANWGPEGLSIGLCTSYFIGDRTVRSMPPPLRPRKPSALERAVEASDPAAVKQALAGGPDPHAWVSGATHLARAAGACDVGVVRALVEGGVTADWAVVEAASVCLAPVRDELLQAVAATLPPGTPEPAIRRGEWELVDALLAHGALLDRSAMAAAAASHRPEVRALLVRAPMTPDDASWLLGHTKSLHDVEVVQALLDAGGDPSGVPDGDLPIAAAARAKCLPCIDLLVARGSAVQGRYGQNAPLYVAVSTGDEEVVRRVLALGADPFAGPDPSATLVTAFYGQLLHVFLEREVPPEVLGPVLRAAAPRDVPTARKLLALGADPTAAVEPLAEHGDLGLLREILALGADPEGAPGTRPLLGAADALRTEAVGLLLAAGADVDARQGEGGPTALMRVARRRADRPEDRVQQEEIVARLLLAGADPGLQDRDGRTAADYADGSGNTELAATLRERATAQ